MSRKMTLREPLIRPATPAEVVAEIKKLRDENERLQELLRGIGANRYWEGRWRDSEAENARLRVALDDCVHGRRDWMEKARRALEGGK